MTLEPQFVGAWQRASISIDGGTPREPARVLWLQAGDAFADLRIPTDEGDLTRIEAFAGITSYAAPALTWHHTLDWNGGFAGYDCGVVDLDGDQLVERGEFERDGECHQYEEVWRRVDPGADGAVLTALHSMVVQVGCHCLAFRDRRRRGGEFDVRHTQRCEGEWRDVIVIGDGAELPRLSIGRAADWEAGSDVVVDGVQWHVADQWG